MTAAFTAEEMDQAYAAVLRRHPDLTGETLDRKARRVAAVMRHTNDGPAWTGPERRARQESTP